jgi:hypothetical protein
MYSSTHTCLDHLRSVSEVGLGLAGPVVLCCWRVWPVAQQGLSARTRDEGVVCDAERKSQPVSQPQYKPRESFLLKLLRSATYRGGCMGGQATGLLLCNCNKEVKSAEAGNESCIGNREIPRGLPEPRHSDHQSRCLWIKTKHQGKAATVVVHIHHICYHVVCCSGSQGADLHVLLREADWPISRPSIASMSHNSYRGHRY